MAQDYRPIIREIRHVIMEDPEHARRELVRICTVLRKAGIIESAFVEAKP